MGRINRHEIDDDHERLGNWFSTDFDKNARGKILPPIPGLVSPPMAAFCAFFLADYKTSMNLLQSGIFIVE